MTKRSGGFAVFKSGSNPLETRSVHLLTMINLFGAIIGSVCVLCGVAIGTMGLLVANLRLQEVIYPLEKMVNRMRHKSVPQLRLAFSIWSL